MRHGESKANELGIIISDMETGRKMEFSLTACGRESVRISANNYLMLGSDTIFVCSPFARTKTTAFIAKDILAPGLLIVDSSLRERYFGIYERTSNMNYEKVWNEDKKDPDYRGHGGESVNDVLTREIMLIEGFEKIISGYNIFLVSHGDPLQILECWFRGINPRVHRGIANWKTAEIRRLSM
jgi:broad specificity phosphatase PhoE